METSFDIDRIIKIEVVPSRLSSYKWLPRKQKSIFFGLIKIPKYHSEGWYYYGCYKECYESGCFDANPSSKESLLECGYLINDRKQVFHRPYATVYLESDIRVTKQFDTYRESEEWVESIKLKSRKNFEIIKHG